ncbi:bis(5'-adenosyl)-triphosphatase enpp4 isoform X2 [Xyrichtys novacula]|uniref:bis(5'-adenosyl)-triphosphatase n=1 Tax=Xyrichtys novacula TaxID=13765 RepID=A0AAV1HLV3_XYRNO|nr:bis(5'-adenosyl)-triphosphatase enpp4 isoform X2 [Xyrichtys novacula]
MSVCVAGDYLSSEVKVVVCCYTIKETVFYSKGWYVSVQNELYFDRAHWKHNDTNLVSLTIFQCLIKGSEVKWLGSREFKCNARRTTFFHLYNRMLLKILLGFLCGAAARQGPPPLLLVSFDGFRADYLQRFPMPNLKLLYSQGVLVEELTSVFVTKTFPNHYTLVTGLYTESHGIVANIMYDPVSKSYFQVGKNNTPWWWEEAEPLWITALDSGYKTAGVMWPGSELAIRNRTPTYFCPYDSDVTFQQRVELVTKWIQGDEKEEGVMFAALYWEEPDRSGHFYGPDNTTAMAKVLKEVDDNIGLLVSELKRTGLWGHINVLIVSDHGMSQCSAERLIQLDDCIHPDSYTLVDLAPVTAIIPHSDPKTMVDLLNECHAHITAYLKEDIPERFHYRNNIRIQPIIVVADDGWTIVQHGNVLPHSQ